ncbi:MAG TPA: integrin alpha [Myxococcota bacterium]|jgi:hypothetical protein|nr:integrin alpha [Myxococcota bacterium]
MRGWGVWGLGVLLAAAAATAAAAAAAGCRPAREAGLYVTVEGDAGGAIAKLFVEGRSAAGDMRSLDVFPATGATTITLPATFALLLQTDARGARTGALDGPFQVCVTARDAADGDLARACNTADLVPGEEVDVTVTLVADGDAGTDAGSDAASDASPDAASPCGNGVIDLGEACDGANIGAATCASFGLASGTLACGPTCTLDVSGCFTCGDSVVQGPELCDGPDVGAADCTKLGHSGGTLGCAADCMSYDEAACTDCGNGMAEPPAEPCDGTDLAGADCTTAGAFSGGVLGCAPSCTFDTSGCFGAPTVPVLREPANGAYVGSNFVVASRRPTFVWEASTVPGGAPITYELNYSTDAGFGAGVTTLMTTVTSHQPAADLPTAAAPPVGARYYWRVRACAASACSAYSPVWRVDVGRSDHDFNGDGFADVLVGALGGAAGAVHLFYGGPGALDTTADGTLGALAAGDEFGHAVAFAGDVDADGFADAVVGAPGAAGGDGAAYVFRGGVAFDAGADGVLAGAPGEALGTAVAGAGDVDGDGFADVVAGAPGSDGGGAGAGAGRAYVYRGGAGPAFDAAPDGTIDGTAAGDALGTAVAGAGDVNSDGFGDVAAGAPGADSAAVGAGRVTVHLGGPGGVVAAPAGVIDGAGAGEAFGTSVAGAGDVDGDGFADVVAGAPLAGAAGGGEARVYFGGAGTSFDANADGVLAGDAGAGAAAGDGFGAAVAAAGDVNGDAFGDLVVGAAGEDGGGAASGVARVFLGGPSAGLDPVADGVLAGGAAGDGLGTAVAGAGDVDADGYADVTVGAPGEDGGGPGAGAVRVYRGAAGPLFDAVADGLILGASPGDAFGTSVASLTAHAPRGAARRCELGDGPVSPPPLDRCWPRATAPAGPAATWRPRRRRRRPSSCAA